MPPKSARPLPRHRANAAFPCIRYVTASPTSLDREIFQTLEVDSYPPLQTAKAYGLRLLRPGCYVYLFYFQHGRMKTRHYQVTEDIRFAHLWWTNDDYNSDTPGSHARPDVVRAAHTVLAPETHIADTVYLMVSEALLSHAVLWRIEQDQGALRSKLAIKVKPAELPMQPHVFDAAFVGNAVAELKNTGTTGIFPAFAGASRRPDFAARYGQALNNLVRNLGPQPGVSPLAVALHDPVGVVSELHHLVTLSVEKKARYAGQHAHRLQSANFIAGYFKAAEEAAGQSAETASTLARQRKLLDYDGAMRFPDLYAKELAKLDYAIGQQVKDIVAWVQHVGTEHLLSLALSSFDLKVKAVADAYEEVVFDCIGGLVHSHEGQQLLQQVVMMPPEHSPFWLAMSNGSQVLASRIKDKTGDIAKGVLSVLDNYLEEYAATPATNALLGLLQALPASHPADVLVRRLRHVVEIRFNATIVMHEVSLAELMRQAREFQFQQAPGSEYLKTWKLPEPRIGQVDFSIRVNIYEWVKVGETTYGKIYNSNSPSHASQPLQNGRNIFSGMQSVLSSSIGPTLAGLGAYLAIINFTSSTRKIRNSGNKLLSYADLAGATTTLIGATIEISALAAALGHQAKGNSASAIGLRVISTRVGVAVISAGGAGIVSVTDALRSVFALRDQNPEQAALYLGAALAGGVISLATWGGGTAAAASMATGAKVVVLGLTPLGWSVIALIALGIGIAFMAGVDIAKHGPVDIWLKHSAWGNHHRRYNNQQELDAIHSLYHRPRLAVDWQQTSGFRVGTLRIMYQLPVARADFQSIFDTRLSFKKKLTTLKPINGPVAHTLQTRSFDFESECLVTPLYHAGKPSGWSIQMHQSAKVLFEYLFIPNLENPEIYFHHHGAPEPLEFRAASLMSDPIDPAKLEPVKAPE
ncbi:toxin VasX [Pseudomonas sp. S37]|uniref:toxin VasX n=1 Tax=Pseudomonas sp. S37 TaxID=2767449 RepID=UPI002E29DDF4|nr:toxin VasX [Pseudomonas sp. S37]